ITQGFRDGIEHVRSADEQDLRQVEGYVEVVVAEGRVLLRIQHFEQRRRWIPAEIAAQLIHFVHHEDRIVGLRPAKILNDLSGKRSDVGPAVSAKLSLVVHTPQRDAGKLAAQRTSDAAPK